ncbi:cyclin-like protein [Powellomyces hirtus]|nr:cyclin-like protein [Powellomyces hirtus]
MADDRPRTRRQHSMVAEIAAAKHAKTTAPRQPSPDQRPILECIIKAGCMLSLEPETSATALVYYHQYRDYCAAMNDMESANVKLDDYMVAMTCTHLACKQCEEGLKMRDIINVSYWLVNMQEGRDPYLKIGEEYWDIKESLMNAELVLLRILRFNVDVRLPFARVIGLLDDLRVDGARVDQTGPSGADMVNILPPAKLVKLTNHAISLAHDMYLCPDIYPSARTAELALAAVYLALRTSGLQPYVSFVEWCSQEGVKGEDLDRVRGIVRMLMTFMREWTATT